MTAHKSEPIQFLLTKSVHCQQTGNENTEIMLLIYMGQDKEIFMQLQSVKTIQSSVSYVSNILVSFYHDFSVTVRLREDKGKDKSQDTGDNTRRQDTQDETLACKEQKQ